MLIVLAHWNYSPRVDISLHFGYIILIPSQQTGQCSYFMSDDVRLVLCYVRVTRSLVFSLMFCRSLFDLLSFSFGHCVVCSSLVYRFWLPPFGIFKVFCKLCAWWRSNRFKYQFYNFIMFGLRRRGLEITSTLTITRDAVSQKRQYIPDWIINMKDRLIYICKLNTYCRCQATGGCAYRFFVSYSSRTRSQTY